MKTLKWTAEDIAQVDAGKFPNDAEAAETLVFGDIDKGFKEADLIIERDIVPADHRRTSRSRSRTAMAYWQNGKLYMHGSTQSVARTVASVAGWVGIKPKTSCSSASTPAADSAARSPARRRWRFRR